MESLYTITLTKGAYVVRGSDANAVLRAIEDQEPHVFVRADVLGEGTSFVSVRVVTAHVVSVIENATPSVRQQRERLTVIRS